MVQYETVGLLKRKWDGEPLTISLGVTGQEEKYEEMLGAGARLGG